MNDFPIIKDINKFIESTERVKYTINREKENLNQDFLDFDKLDRDFDNPRQVLMGDKRVKKPPLKAYDLNPFICNLAIASALSEIPFAAE